MISRHYLLKNQTILPSKGGSGLAIQPIGLTHQKLKKVDNFNTHPQMPVAIQKQGSGFGVPPNNPQLIQRLEKLKVKKPKNISID